MEAVPAELCGIVCINSKADVAKLIPPELCETFTMRDFMKASGLSGKKAWFALRTLIDTGVVSEAGSSGKAKIYKM